MSEWIKKSEYTQTLNHDGDGCADLTRFVRWGIWEFQISISNIVITGDDYKEEAEAKAACEKWLAIVQREKNHEA